ncbi:hypothetical protein CPB97_006395, partial [Podila verticillata]
LPRPWPQQLLPLQHPPLSLQSLQHHLNGSPLGRTIQTSDFQTHARTSTLRDGSWTLAPRFSLKIQNYSSLHDDLRKRPRNSNGPIHTLMVAFTRPSLSHSLSRFPRVSRLQIRCLSSSKSLLPMPHDQLTSLCMQSSRTRMSLKRLSKGSLPL